MLQRCDSTLLSSSVTDYSELSIYDIISFDTCGTLNVNTHNSLSNHNEMIKLDVENQTRFTNIQYKSNIKKKSTHLLFKYKQIKQQYHIKKKKRNYLNNNMKRQLYKLCKPLNKLYHIKKKKLRVPNVKSYINKKTRGFVKYKEQLFASLRFFLFFLGYNFSSLIFLRNVRMLKWHIIRNKMRLLYVPNYLPRFQYQSKYGKHDFYSRYKLNHIRHIEIAKPQSHGNNLTRHRSISKIKKFTPYIWGMSRSLRLHNFYERCIIEINKFAYQGNFKYKMKLKRKHREAKNITLNEVFSPFATQYSIRKQKSRNSQVYIVRKARKKGNKLRKRYVKNALWNKYVSPRIRRRRHIHSVRVRHWRRHFLRHWRTRHIVRRLRRVRHRHIVRRLRRVRPILSWVKIRRLIRIHRRRRIRRLFKRRIRKKLYHASNLFTFSRTRDRTVNKWNARNFSNIICKSKSKSTTRAKSNYVLLNKIGTRRYRYRYRSLSRLGHDFSFSGIFKDTNKKKKLRKFFFFVNLHLDMFIRRFFSCYSNIRKYSKLFSLLFWLLRYKQVVNVKPKSWRIGLSNYWKRKRVTAVSLRNILHRRLGLRDGNTFSHNKIMARQIARNLRYFVRSHSFSFQLHASRVGLKKSKSYVFKLWHPNYTLQSTWLYYLLFYFQNRLHHVYDAPLQIFLSKISHFKSISDLILYRNNVIDCSISNKLFILRINERQKMRNRVWRRDIPVLNKRFKPYMFRKNIKHYAKMRRRCHTKWYHI